MRSLLVLGGWLVCGVMAAGPLRGADEGWSGSQNVGLTIATGNSDSLRATTGLEAAGRFGPWEVLGEADAIYGEDDGIRASERVQLLLQLNRDLSGPLYAGLTGDFLYDPPAGVDYRFGVSSSPGVRLLDGDRITLRVETGPGHVWEDRDGEGRGYVSLRFHEALTIRLTDDTRLFQSFTAVAEAEDLDNYLLTAEAGIESRLAGQWSLRVTGQAIRYGETHGMGDDDLLVTAGFGYNFMPKEHDADSLAEVHGERKSRNGEWVVTALLGGSLAEGNTEARSFSAGARAKRKRRRDEFAAGVFGTYADTGGVESAEAAAADIFYQRRFRELRFVGARGDFLHDALADLDWRLVLTPYVGRYLTESDKAFLSLEAGPSLVFEQQGGSQDTYLGAYAALKAEQEIGSSTRLFGEASWLAETGQLASYVLASEAGLEQSITERISLEVIARSVYDSTPARGRERHDLQLVSVLGVTF